MTLGSTQPLTEMSTKSISWGKDGRYYDPGIDSASNRNEYQEHFLAVKAAGA